MIFSEISLFILQTFVLNSFFGSLNFVEVIELEALKILFKNGTRVRTGHTASSKLERVACFVTKIVLGYGP